jgi:predicted RNase H-like nuclease (RuvC/YqgF family)
MAKLRSIEELEDYINDVKKIISYMESSTSEIDDDINTDYTDRIVQMQDRYDKQIKELEEKITELEGRLEDANEEIKDLKQQLSVLDK